MRSRPDILTDRVVEDIPYRVDEYGYLTDPDAWTPSFATAVAGDEGLTLTEAHWQVIAFMRSYLEERGIAADARFVMWNLAARNGVAKREGRALLFQLFPYGYVKQACKIAGMRQPRAWSTG